MAIAVNSTGSGSYTSLGVGSSPVTLSFNNVAGTVLVVCVDVQWGNQSTRTIDSCTYNGVSMTEMVNALQNAQTASRTNRSVIFYLSSPATGTHDISVSFTESNSHGIVIGAISLTGTDGTGATATKTTDGNPSITTTRINSLIISSGCQNSNATTLPTWTAEAGQTNFYDLNSGLATDEMMGIGYYRSAVTIGSYTVGASGDSIRNKVGAALEIKALMNFVPKAILY